MFQMKQDVRTSLLEKGFLYIFTIYFLRFLKIWRHKWQLLLESILKIWKAVFKTLQTFLLHNKNIYSENPISIGYNGVKLQLIKENQIYSQMTIYGQN